MSDLDHYDIYGDAGINLVGVSHKTLPIAERERLGRWANDPQAAISTLARDLELKEAALIATCNRFEIVSIGSENRIDPLMSFIKAQLSSEANDSVVYTLRNREAVRHLFKVAASLDSLALGEAQILGQVKDAYRVAVDSGLAGKHLHSLFQSAFKFAKKVREHTSVAEGGVSVAFVAVKLAEQIFGDLKKAHVLVLGAGKTAELTALHLRSHGCVSVTVANRTVERAADLAAKVGGAAVPLSELSRAIEIADIVVGSIATDSAIIDAKTLRMRRRSSPLFFIDLGVPRNFSPSVSDLDDVYLYNIDDLAHIASHNEQVRVEASKDADIIIEYGLIQFERFLARLKNEPQILAIRSRIHQVCKDEVERVRDALAERASTEILANELSYRIGQKISHEIQNIFGAVHGDIHLSEDAEIEKLFGLVLDRLWDREG